MDARTPAHEKEKHEERDRDQRSAFEKMRDTIRAHPYIAAGVVSLIIVIAIAVLVWWLNARQYESTDDAFIDARTVSIAAQVSGAITGVEVTDNSDVDANAVLLHIDERNYSAALEQAEAQIAQAQASVANYGAQIEAQGARIEQAKKQVTEAQGVLTFAQQENQRYQDLLRTGTGTEQRAQQTASDLRQRQAALDAAEANETAAEKQVDVLSSQRDAAAGQVKQAEAMRRSGARQSRPHRHQAPVAGRVSKLTAAKGGYAQTGQSLMMFVPRRCLGDGQFQGDAARADARRPAGRSGSRCLSGPVLPRPCRQHPGRQRHGLQPAAGGECDRQLRQGRAARAGEDRVRPGARRAARSRHVGRADRQGAMSEAAPREATKAARRRAVAIRG